VEDTLEVVVVLEEVAEPPELLVRVDPVATPGIVTWPEDAPPAVGAAGATVGTAGSFTVCLSPGPAAIVFQGSDAPHGKAWARVSTDRPVKAVLRLGSGPDGRTLEPGLVVAPGSSDRRRWTTPGEIR
jgi:hypothetical protein